MALKTSGTKLVIEGLSGYVGGLNQAVAANTRLDKSIENLGKSSGRDPFAPLVGQANRAATQIESRFKSLNRSIGQGQGIGGAVLGGVAGFLGVQSLQATIQSAASLDELRGRANSTQLALELLAGGSKQATDAIAQIQSVAPGSTDSLAAAEAAVTILTQKLPTAAVSLKEIAQFAATVPRISASISDSGDALAQLTLFSSSGSFARADQLGVTASEVKDRMKELAAVFPELSDAQIKAAATVQALNDRFGPLQDQLADQVTGWQKLKTAITEFRIEAAKGRIGEFVDSTFEATADRVKQLAQNDKDFFAAVDAAVAGVQNAPARNELAGLQDQLAKMQAGRPDIVSQVEGGFVDPEKLAEVDALIAQVQLAIAGVSAELAVATGEANNLAGGFQSAVDAAAFLPTVVSSISDPLEAFRSTSAEIEDLFGRLNELGDTPGVDALRNQLIGLASEIALAGGSTDETEAKLVELNNALGNLSAGGAIGELLSLTNAEIEARQEAQALSAAIAGIGSRAVSGLAGFVRSGVITEQQANQLNSVIQPQLATAQSQFAARGLEGPGLQLATAAAERAILEPVIGRIEQTEQQRLAAAKDTEKAFKGAAKNADDLATKLRNALKNVPGLFGTSDVTQEQLDLADAGIPQDFADNFVRRLKAEVNPETGEITDKFDDVSIEQARTALERIGTTVADDPRLVVQQLEEAWNNSSLFSSKENLALINKDAVDANLRLQQQMEDGRANIYEFFGLVIEDANDAISGDGGIAAAVPLTDEQIDKIATDANNAVLAKMDAAIAQIVTGAGGGLGLTDKPFDPNALLGGTAESRAGGDKLPDISELIIGVITGALGGGEGAPNINELIANAVTGAFGGTGGKGAPGVDEDLSVIVTGAGTAIQDSLITPIQDTQAVLENFRTSVDGLVAPMTDTGAATVGFNTAIGGATTGFTDLATPLSGTKTKLDDLGNTAEAVADKFNKIVNPDAPLPTDPATTAQASTVGAFALGTRNYPGGMGFGGELGPEMFMTPGGQMGMIGLRGPQRFSLPRGSVILDAGKTRNMVGGIPTQQIISSPSSVDNRVITNNWNLSVNTAQSTGALSRDFAMMRVLAAV